MTHNRTRIAAAIICFGIALILSVVMILSNTGALHAEQCGCPAPVEPPVVTAPLPPVGPGGGYLWLPQIAMEVQP